MSIVRVELPAHLRTLAKLNGEARVEVAGDVTPRTVVDALEIAYPALCGTIRDYTTGERRAFLRFFANEEDFSHAGMDVRLPDSVARGEEPLLVVGAVAGG